MAGFLAVNGSVDINNAVIPLRESGDFHRSAMGNFPIQRPKQLLTDNLRHNLPFRLVRGRILWEEERTLNGILFTLAEKGIHTIAGLGGDGNDRGKISSMRIKGNYLQQNILLH